MPRRQYLDHIESKPKEVIFLDPLPRKVALSQKQEDFLADIVEAILLGKSLPKGAYRASTRRDDLLREKGVMHLHLVHPGSDELVYLVQYPDHVVIVEIGSHNHFTTTPVGAYLSSNMDALRTIQEKRRRDYFLKHGKPPK